MTSATKMELDLISFETLWHGTGWKAVLWVGPLLITAWFLCNAIYNLYLSPLAAFPGPALNAISRIPSAVSVLRGHGHLDVLALHEKYGPAVRLGPSELAFASPQAFRDINGHINKDPSFARPPPNGVPHIGVETDPASHARKRRLLNPAFSKRALREQEGLVRGHVDLLATKLRGRLAGEADRVDISGWMNYATFDITGDLTFGESFGCLRDSALHPWVGIIFETVKALAFVGAAGQFPALTGLLDRLIPRSLLQKARDHFGLCAKMVDRRLEMGAERPDFFSAMLKNGLSEKPGPYTAKENTMSRAELHSTAFAFSSDEDITFAKAASLRYLTAVIQETFRLYPPFAGASPRLVPPGGAAVEGHWLPPGVAVHHYASYHYSGNFTFPESFIPERWLGSDSRFASDKKDVLTPFSLGPRNCIGQTLANAEIRLILCKVLFHFDVELRPESSRWIDQNCYVLWDKPPLWVRIKEREWER
ncbi:cytochrome P450 [Lineolata rhizophorae]|uniref:Cytochrome P450 n=1 Tax=Lineolata rhizophorae TaxID=578093 RepID=A0A6A6P205_9PEZI|nr:cytochrome P450 [Lineolata rhizophorae]